MSIAIVVGGQFGSESKAKAAVASSMVGNHWHKSIVGVRCGGPNAGHTVWIGNHKIVLRLVPSLVVNPYAKLCICGGAMVNVDLLFSEIKALESMGVEVRSRLLIDPETAIVEPYDISTEKSMGLGDILGSTQTGTGATTANRAFRRSKTARQIEALKEFVSSIPVWKQLLRCDEEGWRVIIEGTQGYGLSLYHAGYYPFTTSKPATSSSFAMEAGIPPQCVNEVLMVVRTYPIRVGGNSGPLANEITWETVRERSGYPEPLIEMTSVTKKVRRVGEFDMGMVKDAAKINGATAIAVHGLDYLAHEDLGKRNISHLTKASRVWLQRLEETINVFVVMAFTGPHQDDVVWM